MKLLKRLILFTLASEQDFFNKADGYEYKNYHFLYNRLMSYKTSSIREAILHLVETGEVDKIVRNGTPFFRITSRGRDRLLSFFIISMGQKKVWDHIWRIAIIKSEIRDQRLGISYQKAEDREQKTENRRQRTEDRRRNNKEKDQAKQLRKLRNALINLGFKQISRGVYATPLPISANLREIILKNNWGAYLTVIESRKIIIGDDEQLAKVTWSLENISQAYLEFITKAERLISIFSQKKSLSYKEKLSFSLILQQYFSLLENDPGLPKKLLPDDWPGQEAKEAILKLTNFIKTIKY